MGNSNIHIANGSSKFIRARAAQETCKISNIDASGGLSAGGSMSLSGSIKASLDRELDTTGFARLAPGDALEFDVDMTEGDVYVTITTADDPEPYVIAYNYVPPEGRSIIVTDQLTLQLSQKFGNVWKTDYGVAYGPKNAAWVQKQSDINSGMCGQCGSNNNDSSNGVQNGLVPAKKDPNSNLKTVSGDKCCSIM